MPKLLITGFEPFSDFKTNPSETLVRGLANWFSKQTKYTVETKILPVDYSKVEMWVSQIDFSKFDYIFQFGVAAGRSKVSLERVALNWTESKVADNSGVLKHGQNIYADREPALYSDLDLTGIVNELGPQLENNLEVSFTAGGYVCNYTYFQTKLKNPNTIFVHIPSQLKVEGKLVDCADAIYTESMQKIGLKLIEKIVVSKNLVK